MTERDRLLASAAHFNGIGAGQAPAAPTAPVIQGKDPKKEEPGDEGDPAEEGGRRGKRGKKADDGDETEARRGDDDDEDEEDEEDEEEREEMKKAALIGDPAHRQQAVLNVLGQSARRKRLRGQAAERARCAAIFSIPGAEKNPDFAASIAFKTRLSVEEASALIATAPKGSTLGTRMATVPNPQLGPGGTRPATPAKSASDGWKKVMAEPAPWAHPK